MMAFSAKTFLGETKADSRYIQWLAVAIQKTKDSYTEVNYPMHRCKDDDYDNFYPIVEDAATTIQKFKEENNLFCYDR